MLRRLALVVPTLIGVTFAAFALAHAAPGDAASNYVHRVQANPTPTEEDLVTARHDLGLDRPFLRQYGAWARGALSGRLGLSYATRGPVAGEIARTVPLTMELTALAAAIALLVAVPAGVVSAVLRGGRFDHAARLISIGVASFPSFWLALVLIDIVAVRLRLLPTGGREGWTSLVLPTIVLAAAPAARLARFTRAVILESIEEPYVTAARAKGLTEWRVVLSRALRPALGPLVTAFSLSIGFLLSGAVIVESIFNLPGVGRLSLDAIRQGDYPMIQGVVLYGGVTFAILNLLVDLSYSVIDARVGTAATAAF